MTLKQVFLGILTLLAIAIMGGSLLSSVTQPQIQSRLELYQTNLLLHASEWQTETNSNPSLTTIKQGIIGENGIKTALKQYEEIQESTQTSLNQAQALPELTDTSELNNIRNLLTEVTLKTGILQAATGEIDSALSNWNRVIEGEVNKTRSLAVETAQVLSGIWSQQARILPNSESILSQNLDGWFRYKSLSQLYQIQERKQALVSLQAQEQSIAEQALTKLIIISAIPGIGLFLGTLLLIGLVVQWLLKRKDSILARNSSTQWLVPWNWEIILQVFLVGFFLVGQLVVPIIFSLVFQSFNLQPATFAPRSQAIYVLITYLILMSGGLSVLYFSIRSFFPLPEEWFKFNWRGNWFLWGVGGYLTALPLVIIVSLLNQQIWDGQGGSNPILPIALENRDSLALFIFFITASVAAPLFEEIFFRGFLLPSLTRYLPVWGAILLSSLIFAAAHLNISEVIPLTTLGVLLGFVYTRSRNLLSSILLHGLWNSGTLLSLYILGSGTN
ncbi:MAG: type II CAAX endopeptidase family protein [Microcoleaceae cyanobacterium]